MGKASKKARERRQSQRVDQNGQAPCAEQIQPKPPQPTLSVREIKAQLTRLGVPFEGICEKTELLSTLETALKAERGAERGANTMSDDRITELARNKTIPSITKCGTASLKMSVVQWRDMAIQLRREYLDLPVRETVPSGRYASRVHIEIRRLSPTIQDYKYFALAVNPETEYICTSQIFRDNCAELWKEHLIAQLHHGFTFEVETGQELFRPSKITVFDPILREVLKSGMEAPGTEIVVIDGTDRLEQGTVMEIMDRQSYG